MDFYKKRVKPWINDYKAIADPDPSKYFTKKYWNQAADSRKRQREILMPLFQRKRKAESQWGKIVKKRKKGIYY